MATKDDSTPKPEDNSTNTDKPKSDTTSTQNAPKKKKKKKNTPLYQETAVKYYDGFMKNKRYNKGINLSTGCAIFKTAWELPENNGLILPSRVIRHFKQVLPKKPKTNKNKKNQKKNTTKSKPALNSTRSAIPSSMATASIHSSISPKIANGDNTKYRDVRSRTMVDLHVPKDIMDEVDDMKHDEVLNQTQQQQQRRTIVGIASTSKTTENKDNTSSIDKLEILRDRSYDEHSDEQSYDEQAAKTLKHNQRAQSMANLGDLGLPLSASITSNTPEPPSYIDHADKLEDDLKPDTEELPLSSMDRAETDIKHMDIDMVSFKQEMMKMNTSKKNDNVKDVKNEETESKEKEQKKQTEQKQETVETKENAKPKVVKKKKKKAQILYAEDATKLFKKLSEGKRLKNGITLGKACNIFNVAWELPEENGRILPSKVARHFKQVLPKKPPKKAKGKKDKNIKPSSVTKARTTRANPTMSISVTDDNDEDINDKEHVRSSTVRGIQANKMWATPSKSYQAMPRMSERVNPSNLGKVGMAVPSLQNKKSMVSHLEALISADPNRSKSEDVEKNEIKRKRAGSMTDLHHMLDEHDMDHPDDDQVVENDIVDLYKEAKKQKELKEKHKAKEQDVSNAIDAALGL